MSAAADPALITLLYLPALTTAASIYAVPAHRRANTSTYTRTAYGLTAAAVFTAAAAALLLPFSPLLTALPLFLVILATTVITAAALTGRARRRFTAHRLNARINQHQHRQELL